MNLLLFETAAETAQLAPSDPRAKHLREVLRMKPGDKVYVGVVNGLRGHATIITDGLEGIRLDVRWEEKVESPRPIWILVGMPRPQTARDLLRESATFGVTALYFFGAEKGEPSYADSTLWKSDEWKQRLREGAAQAFATTVPEVVRYGNLRDVLETLSNQAPKNSTRLALDVYEAKAALSNFAPAEGPVVMALGAERGWSASERTILRENDFQLAHLGSKVLRTETALVASLSVLLTKRGEF